MVVDTHQSLVLIGLERENAAVASEHLYCRRRAGESRAKLTCSIGRQSGEYRLLRRRGLENGQIRQHGNGVRLAPPQLLIRQKVEGPISDQGTAECCAKLLPV